MKRTEEEDYGISFSNSKEKQQNRFDFPKFSICCDGNDLIDDFFSTPSYSEGYGM